MKYGFQSITNLTAVAAIAATCLLGPRASACGSSAVRAFTFAAALNARAIPEIPDLDGGSVVPPRAEDGAASITGLWKTVSMSGGSVVMVAFDTFHSDGTELALDGLFPPATGNVCPGVWQKTGPRSYATVHPAFEYDNAGVNIIAIFVERVQITLAADGNSFQGTFTWDNYDFQGKLLPGSLSGTVQGTRIGASSAFPFPFPL